MQKSFDAQSELRIRCGDRPKSHKGSFRVRTREYIQVVGVDKAIDDGVLGGLERAASAGSKPSAYKTRDKTGNMQILAQNRRQMSTLDESFSLTAARRTRQRGLRGKQGPQRRPRSTTIEEVNYFLHDAGLHFEADGVELYEQKEGRDR